MSRKPKSESNGEHIVMPVDDTPPEPQSPDAASQPDDRPNFPCHVIRFGLVRACIWRNQTENGPRHNITVSRLYKGSDDRWYSTASFGYRDLLALAKCLDWAHTYVSEEIATSEVPF